MGHVNIGKQHPGIYRLVATQAGLVDTALAEAGLDPLLGELVKVRVSQINGCAFCLRSHTRDALAKGETTDRLAVLAAWWEAQYFTPVEQAALALAEQVTYLNDHQPHQADISVLTDEQVSALTWLTITMNTWNRVAISSHYPVAA